VGVCRSFGYSVGDSRVGDLLRIGHSRKATEYEGPLRSLHGLTHHHRSREQSPTTTIASQAASIASSSRATRQSTLP
jgi:hypothetical protein